MVELGDTLSKIKPLISFYYAALLNLVLTMEDLHRQRQININFIRDKYGTALQVIYAQGYNMVFKSLIK